MTWILTDLTEAEHWSNMMISLFKCKIFGGRRWWKIWSDIWVIVTPWRQCPVIVTTVLLPNLLLLWLLVGYWWSEYQYLSCGCHLAGPWCTPAPRSSPSTPCCSARSQTWGWRSPPPPRRPPSPRPWRPGASDCPSPWSAPAGSSPLTEPQHRPGPDTTQMSPDGPQSGTRQARGGGRGRGQYDANFLLIAQLPDG